MTPFFTDSIRTALVVAVLLPWTQTVLAQNSGAAFPERTWSEPSSTVQRDAQGRQWDESPGQRALREQAQRDFQSRQVYPGAQYNRDHRDHRDSRDNRDPQYNRERHDEWVQRQQQRRQQEILQGPQLEMQRRQGEEPIGQRALREQAQADRDNQRFREEAQRRSGAATTPNPGSGSGYKR